MSVDLSLPLFPDPFLPPPTIPLPPQFDIFIPPPDYPSMTLTSMTDTINLSFVPPPPVSMDDTSFIPEMVPPPPPEFASGLLYGAEDAASSLPEPSSPPPRDYDDDDVDVDEFEFEMGGFGDAFDDDGDDMHDQAAGNSTTSTFVLPPLPPPPMSGDTTASTDSFVLPPMPPAHLDEAGASTESFALPPMPPPDVLLHNVSAVPLVSVAPAHVEQSIDDAPHRSQSNAHVHDDVLPPITLTSHAMDDGDTDDDDGEGGANQYCITADLVPVGNKANKRLSQSQPMTPSTVQGAIAVYSYEAKHTDELSFRAGSRIELLECPVEGGWWRGRVKNVDGWFPANHARETVDTSGLLKLESPSKATPTRRQDGADTASTNGQSLTRSFAIEAATRVGGTPSDWSPAQVSQWLELAGFIEYSSAWEQNGIHGAHLIVLGKDDLRELGVTRLGDRMSITVAIDALRQVP
jgi:hypothetical protein